MKLIAKILITSAALGALSSTLAFGGDTIVLTPNGHGSYSIISVLPESSPMIGLSVNGGGGENSLGNSEYATENGCHSNFGTLRDNGHGTQVPR